MIIVRFKGGLGNQMLQYATYLALTKRYPEQRVVADTSQYNIADIHNGLELEKVFPVKLDTYIGKNSGPIKIYEKYWIGLRYKLLLKIYQSPVFRSYAYIKDNNKFHEELLSLDGKQNYYLDGYWGSERYFDNVKQELKSRFTHEENEIGDAGLVNDIKTTNSISVHIRRGDYLTAGLGFIDLCKTDYYENALGYFGKRYGHFKLFIFSDDVEWCTENLGWLKEHDHVFVDGNKGNASYKDMQIMALCKGNILANSTFSWWGGWLNKNNGKIIICPKKLFSQPEKNKQVLSNFYPAEWMKLDFNQS